MPADVRKITEARKGEREKLTLEERNVLALELIADQLEALRIETVGLSSAIGIATRGTPSR